MIKISIVLTITWLFSITTTAEAKCLPSTKACVQVKIESFDSKTVSGTVEKIWIPKQSEHLLREWESKLVVGKKYKMLQSHPQILLKNNSTVIALIYPDCKDTIPDLNPGVSFYFRPDNSDAPSDVDCSQR